MPADIAHAEHVAADYRIKLNHQVPPSPLRFEVAAPCDQSFQTQCRNWTDQNLL
ncbi:hypothetical protein FIBSPDRAFT_812962 [Athelia psychrophila]|uniref:Uncharacterized protein n=1 Tax=Athelia psychrophila TaxID=1759441 RepID=A0A166URX0_9AGAM|nr:hypothetical protein FIBSPDRAFT_812962 [Fibularhizoctonia sp. CBS 109695]